MVAGFRPTSRRRLVSATFRHNSRHMEKIRAAVVGLGYLGRFHAQKYALLADCSLVGVVDSEAQVATRVAAEVQAPAYGDFRALLGKVDAVSIVTPTPSHYDIARAFLESGAHVLVEKPITETTEQAEGLIVAAAAAAAGAAGRASGALQSSHPGRGIAADAAAFSSSVTGWRRFGSAAPMSMSCST